MRKRTNPAGSAASRWTWISPRESHVGINSSSLLEAIFLFYDTADPCHR